MDLFSRRKKPLPDTYKYEVPRIVRERIVHTMMHTLKIARCEVDVFEIFGLVQGLLLAEYGRLRTTTTDPKDPILEYYFGCNVDEFMDILELFFRNRWMGGGFQMVRALNRVFETEGIGFELTEIRQEDTSEENAHRLSGGATSYRLIPPQVIRKDEKILHEESVRPCLHQLAHKKFASANAELLDGMQRYRKGDYPGAISSCGCAVESVLKTICKQMKWPFDSQKDTCSKLLDTCREKGLFAGCYKPILEGTATIRNKYGVSHGKGPDPEYVATKEIAEHMIHTCCANIVFLSSLAQI